MFATSGDILNLVLSICITILTFFLCWALYYIISIVGKAKRLVDKANNVVVSAEGLVDTVRLKIKDSKVYLSALTVVANRAFDLFREHFYEGAVRTKTKTTTKAKATPKKAKEVKEKKSIFRKKK